MTEKVTLSFLYLFATEVADLSAGRGIDLGNRITCLWDSCLLSLLKETQRCIAVSGQPFENCPQIVSMCRISSLQKILFGLCKTTGLESGPSSIDVGDFIVRIKSDGDIEDLLELRTARLVLR